MSKNVIYKGNSRKFPTWSPQVVGSSVVEARVQLLLKLRPDVVEPQPVQRVPELVDRDVHVGVQVVGIAQDVLLCVAPDRHVVGGPAAPPGVPEAGVEVGVLGEAGHRLGWVAAHEGLPECGQI